MSDRDTLGYWLSGFSDGEACFHLKGYARKDQPALRFACTFQIGLRADDLSILQEIQRYFECGAIRLYRSKSMHPQNFRSNPRFYFTVDGVAPNIRAILPHFDRYPLRSKKARDYVTYREAVLLLAEVGSRPRNIRVPGGARRWTEADEQRFLALKRQLEDDRAWKDPGVGVLSPLYKLGNSVKRPERTGDGAALVHTYKLDTEGSKK